MLICTAMLTMWRWMRSTSILVFLLVHIVADLVKVITQSRHAWSGENAENVSLMFIELWGCLAAMYCQVFT